MLENHDVTRLRSRYGSLEAARAAASLVQINLTAVPGDPRIQRANQLADDAGYAARRALGPRE